MSALAFASAVVVVVRRRRRRRRRTSSSGSRVNLDGASRCPGTPERPEAVLAGRRAARGTGGRVAHTQDGSSADIRAPDKRPLATAWRGSAPSAGSTSSPCGNEIGALNADFIGYQVGWLWICQMSSELS